MRLLDHIFKRFYVIFTIVVLLSAILSPIIRPVFPVAAQSPGVSLPAGSPVSLKLDALSLLGIANGSGSDKAVISQARSCLNCSVSNDYWDDDHLKNPLTLAGDLLIIKSLLATNA
jgi:hypothetical protein